MNKSKYTKDGALIGAALFSMFFGAGNMIFPPYLGMQSGYMWIVGFLCYFAADIGLALMAIAAQVRHGGFEGVLAPVGKRFGRIIMFVIVICLGPLISIPRTAATTFELSVLPLMPDANMWMCYALFFGVAFVLCMRESAVVDVIGKILTPVLFAGLLILIIIGVINPPGNIADSIKTSSVAASGIQAGYQSLDALGAILFGVLIINSAKEKGYTSYTDIKRVIFAAGAVAGIGLLIVYLGLTYLGACVSEIFDNHTYRSELLISIIDMLIPGEIGIVFFAVIAGFACLSTAVALTGSCAKYFCSLPGVRIPYAAMVAVICIVSMILSFAGLEQIVTLASPVLNVLYPPVILLLVISFFRAKSKY